MELVDGLQQRGLALAPARRRRPLVHARDVRVAEARAPGDVLVVAALVLAVAVGRDAQDHELGVAARELAAGHERAREAQPAPEQAPVPRERGEQVRRPVGARGAADDGRDQRVGGADLRTAAGGDARPAVRDRLHAGNP